MVIQSGPESAEAEAGKAGARLGRIALVLIQPERIAQKARLHPQQADSMRPRRRGRFTQVDGLVEHLGLDGVLSVGGIVPSPGGGGD